MVFRLSCVLPLIASVFWCSCNPFDKLGDVVHKVDNVKNGAIDFANNYACDGVEKISNLVAPLGIVGNLVDTVKVAAETASNVLDNISTTLPGNGFGGVVGNILNVAGNPAQGGPPNSVGTQNNRKLANDIMSDLYIVIKRMVERLELYDETRIGKYLSTGGGFYNATYKSLLWCLLFCHCGYFLDVIIKHKDNSIINTIVRADPTVKKLLASQYVSKLVLAVVSSVYWDIFRDYKEDDAIFSHPNNEYDELCNMSSFTKVVEHLSYALQNTEISDDKKGLVNWLEDPVKLKELLKSGKDLKKVANVVGTLFIDKLQDNANGFVLFGKRKNDYEKQSNIKALRVKYWCKRLTKTFYDVLGSINRAELATLNSADSVAKKLNSSLSAIDFSKVYALVEFTTMSDAHRNNIANDAIVGALDVNGISLINASDLSTDAKIVNQCEWILKGRGDYENRIFQIKQVVVR